MPPLPPTPSTLRVVVNTHVDTSTSANVFHVQYAGGTPSNANLNDFAEQFGEAYAAELMNNLSDELVLDSVEVQDLTSGATAFGFAAFSETGDVASPALPANVAACISWRIARRYRGGHPRTYLPGVPVVKQEDATSFSDDAVGDWLVNANAFRGLVNAIAVSAMTFTLGQVSYYTGGALRAAGLFEPFILGTQVDNRIDTQRRRLGRDR